MMQLVFKFCFCLFDYFSDVILINCTGLCLSVQKIVISSVTINVHRETLNTLSVFTDAFLSQTDHLCTVPTRTVHYSSLVSNCIMYFLVIHSRNLPILL